MNKNAKANRINVQHSNIALTSSMLALVSLTFIAFIYNIVTIVFNVMQVLALVSWITGTVLIYFVNKKDVSYFEYSLFFLVLSVCLYMTHGVPFPTVKISMLITVAFILLYWLVSIIIHCFVLPKKEISKRSANIILTVLSLVAVVIVATYIVISSKMPGFTFWI